jgi:hypothetical protein
MEPMREANAKLKSWGAAGFVATTFFVLWFFSLLRLHKHYDGEEFLHWNGALDSLLSIMAPVAIVSRLWQTKKARKESTQ